jgi:hypothetical protein
MDRNFRIGDLVRVMDKQGTQVHRGQVVRLTTNGAYVYLRRKNQNDNDGDVDPTTCGWWPFKSQEFSIQIVTPVENLKNKI